MKLVKVVVWVSLILSILGIYLIIYNFYDSFQLSKLTSTIKVESKDKKFYLDNPNEYPSKFQEYLLYKIQSNSKLYNTILIDIEGEFKLKGDSKPSPITIEQISSPPIGLYYKAMVPGGTIIRFMNSEHNYFQYKVFGVFSISNQNDLSAQDKNIIYLMLSFHLLPSTFLKEKSFIISETEGKIQIEWKRKEGIYTSILNKSKEKEIIEITSSNKKGKFEFQLTDFQRKDGYEVPSKIQLHYNVDGSVMEEQRLVIKKFQLY